MKKNKLSRYFLLLTIFTFITIFTLIVQKSYDNLIKATIEVQKSSLTRPINPSLNLELLEKIEKRPEIPLPEQ